jgi:hypothetical protein
MSGSIHLQLLERSDWSLTIYKVPNGIELERRRFGSPRRGEGIWNTRARHNLVVEAVLVSQVGQSRKLSCISTHNSIELLAK